MSVVLLPVRDSRLNPVRAFYALHGAASERERLIDLFCDDVVLLPSPWLTVGPYRPYFGRDGILEWCRRVRSQWHDVRLVPERFEPIGAELVLVFGAIAIAGREREAAWAWTLRDGRIRAVRSFRYYEEALRFAEPSEAATPEPPAPPLTPVRPRLA